MLYVSKHIYFYPLRRKADILKCQTKTVNLTVGLWVVETEYSLRHHNLRKRIAQEQCASRTLATKKKRGDAMFLKIC